MSIELGEKNTERLNEIKDFVRRKWHEYDERTGQPGEKKPRTLKVPYTPHDDRHSERIEGILAKLLPNNEVVDRAFSEDGKFLLLAAVWLHDIGMHPNLFSSDPIEGQATPAQLETFEKELRRRHHERSANLIKSSDQLPLSPEERDDLATIAFLHRKSEKIPKESPDNISLTLAYLRLADALHIPDRAPLGELRTHLASGMDPVSKYHWFKSFYFAGFLAAEPAITVYFKLPLEAPPTPNGTLLEAMSPLVKVLTTELRDELDSVKDIFLKGKLRYGLPVYFDVEPSFKAQFLTAAEIAEMTELLSIIELFNPWIAPNSGRIVDIVLNQLERRIDLKNVDASIGGLHMYLENTLKPLLRERPCHVYLKKVRDELEARLGELERQQRDASGRAQWLGDISITVKALREKRNNLERDLSLKVLDTLRIAEDDSILLYGYSSSVIKVLKALPEDTKKKIQVCVCQCSTKTKHRYDNRLVYCDGIIYMRELRSVGIDTIYYVPDSCASNLFLKRKEKEKKQGCKSVTKVFFGANGIDKNTGKVAHGLGHLAIADMAEKYGVPVCVIAESMKIGDLEESPGNMRAEPWYPTDVQFDDVDSGSSYNPREDVVPIEGRNVAIITEKGSSPPKSRQEISSDIKEIENEYRANRGLGQRNEVRK